MIRPSSVAEIRELIDLLDAPEEARREAAVARLIIIGHRAVGRLVSACDGEPSRRAHAAILRVLEATGDDRALPAARQALGRGGDIAVAAIAVVRECLQRGAGATHAEALDILLTVSTDYTVEHRVRAAATEALDSAPDYIRRAVGRAVPAGPRGADALWQDAADGRLPDDPRSLRDVLPGRADRAPLPDVRRIVDALHERERGVAPEARQDWRAVRGALHQALALRGSRVALYDLRETVDRAAEPLPPSFLAALRVVGDASCLEPIAAAFARAPEDADRWRHQLADVFHAIARRERITRRHVAMRRALAKAPALDAQNTRRQTAAGHDQLTAPWAG